MDLIEELDSMLNNDGLNSSVNDGFYDKKNSIETNNTLMDNNVAEKEDDPKSVKDFCNADLSLEHENDEFQDCFVLSDEEDDEDLDFLSSDEDISEEESNNNNQSIEKFLQDCEKITDNSDEEKQNYKIMNIVEQSDDNMQNKTISDESNGQNKTLYDIENNIESGKLFPEKIIDIYDPDFELLDLRINQLWKQIDEIQRQIKEEKELSKEEAKEIREFLTRTNHKNNALMTNYKDLNPNKNIFTGKDTTYEEKINDNGKIMETKGTNTFISAQTEARVSAKKELIKKMSIINEESEANMFKRKLKEVEELCATELNKVTDIICQLHSLQDEDRTINKPIKQEKLDNKVCYYENPFKNVSNISLSDTIKASCYSNKNNDDIFSMNLT